MAKKFNIHDWQAKQRLVEQEDFTPDLEDDELKRGAIQQMMDKEKESSWKPSNFEIKSNIEKTWESYEIMTDDLIEFIQMQYDANGSDIIEDWNDLIRKIQEKLKSLGGDEDEDYSQMGPFAGGNPLDDFPELGEQNSLGAAGAGTSITTGNSDAYATPRAFSKKKNKKIK